MNWFYEFISAFTISAIIASIVFGCYKIVTMFLNALKRKNKNT